VSHNSQSYVRSHLVVVMIAATWIAPRSSGPACSGMLAMVPPAGVTRADSR
jgi:hypothetical protein